MNIDKLCEDMTLRLCRVGGNSLNQEILNLLSKKALNCKQIAKRIGLTHMPTWKRVDMMIKAGLIVREKQLLYRTGLADKLEVAIKKMQKKIADNLTIQTKVIMCATA